MKKVKSILLLCVLALILSCSGSDTYRGDWKATNAEGEQYNLTFEAKKITVTNADGEVAKYTYTQNSVSIENGIETYGINLGDGRKCQLNFPLAKDETVGVLLDGNNMVMYAISRNDYITYDAIFALD